ncbi:MAG: hypothetical protein AAF926_00585 [Pseudomonadota bacterium]
MKKLLLLGGLLMLPALSLARDSAPPDLSMAAQVALEAVEHRMAIIADDEGYSGAGWDVLVDAAREAQFLLLGEEHGIAENPKLAAALFAALQPHGYRHVAIEVSPFMAGLMDDRLAEAGMEGLLALFAEPGGEPAFFGMREEAEMLAHIRSLLPEVDDVLWGADYEVLGDRQMIAALEAMDMPATARAALATVREASTASWARYEETRNPGFVFSFSGDPALIRDVEAAWPDRSAKAAWILDQIEETLEINRLFVTGENYASNLRRADWLVENFLRYWRDHAGSDDPPRVLAKFGASHMVRGRNSNGVFDLGTTLPELASLEGRAALSVMVLPGRGSATAVFDPTTLSFRPGPPKDGYGRGLAPFYESVLDEGYTLFDLRPLRARHARSGQGGNDALLQTLHGFDYLLILSGSTPSSSL